MFLNRREAGHKLASILLAEKNLKEVIIVSLPRGGVIVGDVIAKLLESPHTVVVVKKIGAPGNSELALGATGSGRVVFWDKVTVSSLKIGKKEQDKLLAKTIKIVNKKEKNLGLKTPNIRDKTIILVDDGVATGATAITASMILRKLGSEKIILATPVIAKHTKREISKYFDKIITAELPQDFRAVGEFYEDFPQVEDSEVKNILSL